MSARSPIDFYFDLSSPYAYFAAQWITEVARRHARPLRWHAVLLGVLFQRAELKPPVLHPVKGDYMRRDFARSARFEGIAYCEPDRFPIPTQNAARVFWWLHDTRGPAAAEHWAQACFAALFTRNVPLDEPAGLKALADEAGVGGALAEQVWNDPAWKQRLKQANDDAAASGVFGAPFFIVDGEPFWGNDRRAQLERWLADGPF